MPIPSPYNFVPLSDKVFFPEWADQVSMDIPFRDGISGTLKVRVVARTPIYIRAGGAHADRNSPEYWDFFRAAGPGGPYAIPGTSLKGMLRSVVEIASFGKMVGTRTPTGRVSDHRYAVRDLQNPNLYTSHITETTAQGYRPKVRAAWLAQDGDGGWSLRFCQLARVEQAELEAHFRRPGALAPRQAAEGKYAQIPIGTLIRFDCGPEQPHNHSNGKRLVYRRATNLGNGGTEGTIVLTGQPVPRNGQPGRKHMEFIFFQPDNGTVPVPETVKKDFIFAHSELGENRAPNREWRFWKERLEHGRQVPVFVLMDEQNPNTISSMGLAMMFRLPYRNSIHQTIGHTSVDHFDGARRDLAELLFGHVEETEGLRGRVAVETLLAEGDPLTRPKVETVLSGPKPTYYPNYIRQEAAANDDEGKMGNASYRTFMDEKAEIRGWKRFIRPPDGFTPDPPPPPSEPVATRFKPLPAGTAFAGTIHVHNLQPAELGALVWAVTWGGDRNLRHQLGMGKPYGFGSVTVEVEEANLGWCDPNRPEPIDLLSLRRQFEGLMGDWWKECSDGKPWSLSPQIRALKTIANPEADWPQERRYPSLGDHPRNNEFVQNKRPENRCALVNPLKVETQGNRPQPPPPPPAKTEPAKPACPADKFLAELDNLGANKIQQRLKALELTPESVTPDKRLLIYQRMKKKPGVATNYSLKSLLEEWKPS